MSEVENSARLLLENQEKLWGIFSKMERLNKMVFFFEGENAADGEYTITFSRENNRRSERERKLMEAIFEKKDD